MFNILVNNIDISNLFAFIHNMSAVIYGITQFFYPSDYFLLLDSQKYNYTLSQGGMSIFKVLGTYNPNCFQKDCANLYLPKKYVRGTFHCSPGRS